MSRSSHLELLLCLWLLPVPASATLLCLETRASREAAALRRLAETELARHPGYRLVGSGCSAQLLVELISLGGQQHLTVRLNQEVPVRYPVKPTQIAEKLAEAVSLVLQHDPVELLQDISRLSRLQRFAHSVLRRGHTLLRLELFQTIAAAGSTASFAPGAAVALSRGADHWQVLARIYFAGAPGQVHGRDRALRVHAGADAGLVYELSARASASFYLAATLGVQFLRFEGSSALTGQPESAQQLGLDLGARLGLRLLRHSRFDLDLFAAGYLPFFKTHDPDSELVNAYTPALQLGIGVGF